MPRRSRVSRWRGRVARNPLTLVVLAGLALRLGWSVYAVRTPLGLHDPGLYRALAASIAEGNGYAYPFDIGATAYYPPGYPVLLAPFVWVFEHSFLPGGVTAAVVALNLIAGAATIVLTAAVARRLAGPRAALVAALLVAVWPNLVVHSAVALSETLFLPLLLAIALVAVDAFGAAPAPWDRGALNRRPDVPRLIGLGLLVAAATYVRPVALPIIGVLLVAGRVRGLSWRRTIGATALVALVALIGLLPWVLRNHGVVGSYTLSTNTGDNLCMSRQPGANGAFLFTVYCAGDITADISRGDYERLRDDAGREKAIDFVRDHPLTELKLWPQRLWHTVENDFDGLRAVESYGDDPFLSDGLRRAVQLLGDLWFVLVVLAAAVALPRVWKSERGVAVLVVGAIVAAVVLPAIAFFGDPRFHVPAAPFLAVLASVVLARRRPVTA